MQLSITQGNIVEQQTDCLVVNLFEGVTAPGGATGAADGGPVTIGGSVRLAPFVRTVASSPV